MTHQRKRAGIPCVIYPLKVETDSRGNVHKTFESKDNPINTVAWIYPQRGAKAEVIGQQQIDVIRIGTKADMAGVELGCRVEFRGEEWDIVTPPSYHHGIKRHTRHWSFDLRRRP